MSPESEPMTEARALEILRGWFDPNDPNSLHCAWSPGEDSVYLAEGHYSADTLEAIAWWISKRKAEG